MPLREHATEDNAPEAETPEGMAAREQIIRMPAQVAQLLISLRRQWGLSQAALAQKAGGISQARLSALELNPGRFTLERLLLILAALDLELVVRPRRRSTEPAEW
jgi:HTH-type transcriptional regulator/antitoxin HipB